MNYVIIKNWNSVVKADDDVYVLGDYMLNDNTEGLKCMRQLNGRLHIIWGNHDTLDRIEAISQLHNVVEVLGYSAPLNYGGYHFLLSHYPTLTDNLDNDKPLKRRTINICGHCHSDNKFSDVDKGLIYHAELDAHNMFPVSADQVIKDMEELVKNVSSIRR